MCVCVCVYIYIYMCVCVCVCVCKYNKYKWSYMLIDTQSAQISQKQERHKIYIIMKSTRPLGYHHKPCCNS